MVLIKTEYTFHKPVVNTWQQMQWLYTQHTRSWKHFIHFIYFISYIFISLLYLKRHNSACQRPCLHAYTFALKIITEEATFKYWHSYSVRISSFIFSEIYDVVPPPSLSVSRKELVFTLYFQVAGDCTPRQLHYQSFFVMLLLEGGGGGGDPKRRTVC
jgi:hypothetical protein